MKNKLMKNFAIKILSVIVAFIIWLVIINITDPTVTKSFTGIPVEILNENVITSSNQVYEVEEGDTVDVTVKGKRSFIEDITEEDFTASADLSKLSTVNTAGIQVKLNKYTKENIELNWNNEVLRISLEERSSQQFKVQITAEGELADNYVLGEITAQPNMIEVSGGKSKIKRIASIGAQIQLNGQSSDFEASVTPILYDSDKDVIDGTNVTFSKDKIRVNVQVLPSKTVPIYVDVKGTPAEGYSHIQTDYRPESVMVSGSREELEKLKSITIPVDIGGAKRDIEKEEDLTKYLDSAYKLADEFTTVSIRCVIEKNGKRTFSFVNSDINLKNLPSNLNFSYVDENQRHNITITGGEEDLKNVTLTSLGASIDVSGLTAGRHTVEVSFDLPENLKLKSKVRVEVLLTQSEGGQQEPTAPPAAGSDE
ncbi:MAG: CdaR family protein [Roseburia sp.]|nr:CdaR family protein [Roseburia sp.]